MTRAVASIEGLDAATNLPFESKTGIQAHVKLQIQRDPELPPNALGLVDSSAVLDEQQQRIVANDSLALLHSRHELDELIPDLHRQQPCPSDDARTSA